MDKYDKDLVLTLTPNPKIPGLLFIIGKVLETSGNKIPWSQLPFTYSLSTFKKFELIASLLVVYIPSCETQYFLKLGIAAPDAHFRKEEKMLGLKQVVVALSFIRLGVLQNIIK